ncbi:hypothetical protein WOSG25_050020 [Weissella oryzae SG25]|uniref:Uncharacterized protein n=1 Tax=Weissella oryzae (strain DSM 25784 / JCM 18191 / LMG 30913 / SG25) TaxID=1329250 RepID=A0A069CSD1_WEIOS|nr:hypothetical protein [Weissella oryzae]GAK30730.1 hypothetical protein WOSG25_050020 [Weissella oryzae SG25]
MTKQDEFANALRRVKKQQVQEGAQREQEVTLNRQQIEENARQVIKRMLQDQENNIRETLLMALAKSHNNRILFSITFNMLESYNLTANIGDHKLILLTNEHELRQLNALKFALADKETLRKMLNKELIKLIRQFGLIVVTDRWIKKNKWSDEALLSNFVYTKKMFIKKMAFDLILVISQILISWVFFRACQEIISSNTRLIENTWSIDQALELESVSSKYMPNVYDYIFVNILVSFLWLLGTYFIPYKSTNFSVKRAVITLIIIEVMVLLNVF